jgi:hypothetical protein
MSDETIAAAAAPPQTPAATAASVFDNADKRMTSVPLQWPVTVDGKRYDRIILHRMTQGEVAAFIVKIAAGAAANSGAEVRFPIYFDVDGNAVPAAAMDGLDDDDAYTLQEVARDFLPRRFRPTLEASATGPSNGGTTGPT